MNILKTALALALTTSLTAPVMAADLNFYGRANVSAQMSDDGDGSFSEVKSNDDSRMGVSGGHKVNDNLEVIFKVEYYIDMDGDGKDDKEYMKPRNQYVGLKSNFGTVMLGIRDTAVKDTSNKGDIFNDHEGDIKVLWEGENRESESITYYTPNFGLFKAGVTYISESNSDYADQAGVSASLTYGDKGLKSSDLYAFVAADSEVDGHDLVRVGVTTKFNNLKVNAMVQTQEEIETGEEMEGIMLSAAYKMNQFTFRGQVQTADYDDAGEQFGISAGVDYFLAKNARLYVNYNTFDMDTADDKEYFATGIAYTF